MGIVDDPKFLRTAKAVLFAIAIGFSLQLAAQSAPRWTAEKANAWYQQQPWLVGANYIPASAINELEMWQADTFDPQQIDKELGWAESLGMNTMRVFLHDLLWQQDAKGFQQRLDQFLTIAAKHHIKPMLVLFDSCWDPLPKLGKQRAPMQGVHNSGLGAESWGESAGGCFAISAAEVLRCGSRGRVRQRSAHTCLGRVERARAVSSTATTNSRSRRTKWNS